MKIVYYIRLEEENNPLWQFQTVLRKVRILSSTGPTSSGRVILKLQFVDEPEETIYATPDELYNEYDIEQAEQTYQALLICAMRLGIFWDNFDIF